MSVCGVLEGERGRVGVGTGVNVRVGTTVAKTLSVVISDRRKQSSRRQLTLSIWRSILPILQAIFLYSNFRKNSW